MDEFNSDIDLLKKPEHYDDSDIQVLEGLEAVRKRPGMYIGSTSSVGLHHLIWEIVDNGIDEALGGFASEIKVTIDENNIVEVSDDGRGIPTGVNAKTGKSTVETIYTVLHAGGKFGGGAYKVSGGLHGVGASVVNALSEFMEVTVEKDGEKYFIRFVDGGKVDKPLEKIGTTTRHGTTVRFKADPKIFQETTVYDHDTLRERLRELAFLNKGIKLCFTDKRKSEDHYEEYVYAGGIKEYVEYLTKNKSCLLSEPVYVEGVEDNVLVEVSFQYDTGYSSNIYSYCNNINTHEGGTHEEGFRNTLTRIINNYAKERNLIKKDKDETLAGEDVREGITAIVSIKHPDPQYEGQTKTKLGNSEVRKIVSSIFAEKLERFLMENPNDGKLIVEKAQLALKARVAAKKAREQTRRKNPLELTPLPGKLADCSSTDASKCEIFIVEGDSAGGSAKEGRNRKYQAILPLRGKILNVEKAREQRIFDNAEIRSMFTAFGCGYGENVEIDKLRYHKIIIMTDADVDGAHIRTLLLTFFYRYLKPVIEGGYVYFAQPPLYKLSKGNKEEYAYSDDQMEKIKAEMGQGVKLQRYKGLGEMDASQLKETTMDSANRILIKVNIENAIEADQAFEMLMGDEVEPRKNYIIENAHFVKNLDIV